MCISPERVGLVGFGKLTPPEASTSGGELFQKADGWWRATMSLRLCIH